MEREREAQSLHRLTENMKLSTLLHIFLILTLGSGVMSADLDTVVEAIRKLINYYHSSYNHMNLDGIYGLRLLEGECLLVQLLPKCVKCENVGCHSACPGGPGTHHAWGHMGSETWESGSVSHVSATPPCNNCMYPSPEPEAEAEC